MPTTQFWNVPAESAAVHYYSGSLLEQDGRASLPDLQRGLDELIATIDRWPVKSEDRSPPAVRHFLKVWLGTDGATTPLHYDTQHNVYAQLSGTKHFWLLSPNAARRGDVQLYPRIHPLSHFVRGFKGGGGQGSASFTEALRAATGTFHPCFDEIRRWSCVMHVTLEPGAVLYLPPFWLHRASCGSAACASANVWVSSHAMHRMQAIEAMPLPFESEWALPTRYASVLAFLRALLRWVSADEDGEEDAITHRRPPPPPSGVWYPPQSLTPGETVGRLLSTRWQRAEAELLRSRPRGPSHAQQLAASAACEPTKGAEDDGVDRLKIERYARERAAAFALEKGYPYEREPDRSWRAPKLLLLHDQLERIAHWATDADAAATHALLRRLQHCCERRSGGESSRERDLPAGHPLADEAAPEWQEQRRAAAERDEL